MHYSIMDPGAIQHTIRTRGAYFPQMISVCKDFNCGDEPSNRSILMELTFSLGKPGRKYHKKCKRKTV